MRQLERVHLAADEFERYVWLTCWGCSSWKRQWQSRAFPAVANVLKTAFKIGGLFDSGQGTHHFLKGALPIMITAIP